ncbi:MAG: tyrosine--tRNA ligase [Deltaproteobacteria bacterium]|nr:tyrosine--tRNA ligase [Deltaproteobacteria bacterium]
MNLLDDLRWRGLLFQTTDETVLREAFARGTSAYIGFDPTGKSLHVGSLLQMVNLLRLARAGQRAIAIVGGGTGLIGDPSGKSAERKLMTSAEVAANVDLLRRQLSAFFERAGARVEIIDNGQWLGGLQLVPFLRDIGKHFSVNAMVQRESVRSRLAERDQGISYTEFSYMLLQAYDFLELYRRHGCEGQVGGSDQWGNIVSGLDLIDRLGRGGDGALTAGRPWGLTVPLLTTKAGHKFGKTETGTVWLDPALTSPYQLYQFWMHTEDGDVDRYLRYFTFLPHGEIEALMDRHTEKPHLRQAQKVLAAEVVGLIHPESVAAVQAATAVLFGGDPLDASAEALEVARREVPSFTVGEHATIAELLVGEGRLFASAGEARRAIAAGAVFVSGSACPPDLKAAAHTAVPWLHGQYVAVRFGRKNFSIGKRVA